MDKVIFWVMMGMPAAGIVFAAVYVYLTIFGLLTVLPK